MEPVFPAWCSPTTLPGSVQSPTKPAAATSSSVSLAETDRCAPAPGAGRRRVSGRRGRRLNRVWCSCRPPGRGPGQVKLISQLGSVGERRLDGSDARLVFGGGHWLGGGPGGGRRGPLESFSFVRTGAGGGRSLEPGKRDHVSGWWEKCSPSHGAW
ncbi:hypothetical protein VTI74DRAFT_1631 [Chaetomium olivicolor]